MEIKVDKLSFDYQKDIPIEKRLINKLSFTIEQDKITVIIGKNGSGKTTLLELMNGLLKPQSGKIIIGDYVIDKKNTVDKEFHKKVGFLFQFPEEQFFHSTVEKEIGFSVDQFQYRVNEKEKRVKEALLLVGLNDSYLKRDPLTLSNVEMRKVALASILIYNPKVLFLDEPTVGFDEENKKSFLKLIKRLKKRYHKTIIMVSHDIEFIHKFADEILVLDNGKLITQGDKYEVFKQEKRMKEIGLTVPKMIQFSNLVYEKKGKKIGYRDEINDLIKDIYRYVK